MSSACLCYFLLQILAVLSSIRDVCSILSRRGLDTIVFDTLTTVHSVIPCAVAWKVLLGWDRYKCTFTQDSRTLPVFSPSLIQDWFTMHLETAESMYP